MPDLKEHKEKIEQIMAEMNCPKDFKCYKSDFEKLCKAKDNGLNGYADCLESDWDTCPFKLSFGYGKFCCCPLRVYFAQNVDK